MKKEAKKNEGPTCACGKGDLYEEWLKKENKITLTHNLNNSKNGK